MARKPSSARPGKHEASGSPRDRVIDALMALCAEKPFGDIGLAEIAERAGVSLAEFRDLFPSKGAILGAFTKRIDHIVLEGTTGELAEEPARERVLDIMMRRFDALRPLSRGVALDLARPAARSTLACGHEPGRR